MQATPSPLDANLARLVAEIDPVRLRRLRRAPIPLATAERLLPVLGGHTGSTPPARRRPEGRAPRADRIAPRIAPQPVASRPLSQHLLSPPASTRAVAALPPHGAAFPQAEDENESAFDHPTLVPGESFEGSPPGDEPAAAEPGAAHGQAGVPPRVDPAGASQDDLDFEDLDGLDASAPEIDASDLLVEEMTTLVPGNLNLEEVGRGWGDPAELDAASALRTLRVAAQPGEVEPTVSLLADADEDVGAQFASAEDDHFGGGGRADPDELRLRVGAVATGGRRDSTDILLPGDREMGTAAEEDELRAFFVDDDAPPGRQSPAADEQPGGPAEAAPVARSDLQLSAAGSTYAAEEDDPHPSPRQESSVRSSVKKLFRKR